MSQTVMIPGSPYPFELFVSQWLRLKGYIVQSPLNFIPGGKPSGNWSDIDVVGVKKNEVIIVECKEWINVSKIKDLQKKFVDANDFLASIGFTKGKNVEFVLAQMEKIRNLTIELNNLSKKLGYPIKHVDFEEMLKDIMKSMKPYITKTYVGKFSEPITWMISRLIFEEWIGIPKKCPHCSKEVYDFKYCYECGEKLHT
jgi:hypothetical protein